MLTMCGQFLHSPSLTFSAPSHGKVSKQIDNTEDDETIGKAKGEELGQMLIMGCQKSASFLHVFFQACSRYYLLFKVV